MRTAEEIQLEYVGLCDHANLVQTAINEARKEAIEECAKKATTISVGRRRQSVPTGSNFNSVMAHVEIFEVDKKSILNLINELK